MAGPYHAPTARGKATWVVRPRGHSMAPSQGSLSAILFLSRHHETASSGGDSGIPAAPRVPAQDHRRQRRKTPGRPTRTCHCRCRSQDGCDRFSLVVASRCWANPPRGPPQARRGPVEPSSAERRSRSTWRPAQTCAAGFMTGATGVGGEAGFARNTRHMGSLEGLPVLADFRVPLFDSEKILPREKFSIAIIAEDRLIVTGHVYCNALATDNNAVPKAP